tara:strand:+ start:221 stop:805 length:585 start_codon:yes stop_codon:yes gene_type:complete
MESFVTPLVQQNPLVWFGISIFMWILVGFTVMKVFTWQKFKSQGVTTIRIRMNKRIFVEKLRALLAQKARSYEERRYEEEKDIVKLTYEERDPKDWGGDRPRVVIEYDERNQYLLDVTMSYNRRAASKTLGFNAEELREKLLGQFEHAGIYDHEGEDHSSFDLAVDKRAAIELQIEAEEAAGEAEEEAAGEAAP